MIYGSGTGIPVFNPSSGRTKKDIEESNQGEDKMDVGMQASLSEIWHLVDPE